MVELSKIGTDQFVQLLVVTVGKFEERRPEDPSGTPQIAERTSAVIDSSQK